MSSKSLVQAMGAATVVLLLWFSSSAVSAQTTEGKDFWVTFLRHDTRDGDDKPIQLSLSISAREECDVTIQNPYSGYDTTLHVLANSLVEHLLYTGTAKAGSRNLDKALCYSFNSEIADTSALHVTSTTNISLFASAWKSKSFDASNVMPTSSLLSDYYIQAYTPNDHGNAPQGTHFAIVATEDNTVVDYVPTVKTSAWTTAYDSLKQATFPPVDTVTYLSTAVTPTIGDTLSSPVLKKGQVFYVWTGNGSGEEYDLSGTYVHARNNKKIAVFMGNPHTNVPRFKNRDHLFEQALPTDYWGRSFAITSSLTRKRDKILVMAQDDGTEVYINDSVVYTFDFSTNPKRTYEFEIGMKDLGERSNADINFDNNWKDKVTDSTPIDALGNNLYLVEGTSCKLETSCPSSVYLLMVSNEYDGNDKGDPALVWVNPLEQVINEITFATYKESNIHYVNIVTDSANVASMMLDSVNIKADFEPVSNDSAYWYARKNVSFNSHTLKAKNGFIAHVYGYGNIESYAYSAGGSTNILSSAITINDITFTAGAENPSLCYGVGDTAHFKCDVANANIYSVEWKFKNAVYVQDTTQVFAIDTVLTLGAHHVDVIINYESKNMCKGDTAKATIPIDVIVEGLSIELDSISEFICIKEGSFRVYYKSAEENSGDVTTCKIEYDASATKAGFSNSDITVNTTEQYFEIPLPTSFVASAVTYQADLLLKSACSYDTVPLSFVVNYAADSVLTQRWNDVIAVKNTDNNYYKKDFRQFQWYKNGAIMAGDTASYIYLNGQVYNSTDRYYVRLVDVDGYSLCSCPYTLVDKSADEGVYDFGSEITISATYVPAASNIRISADASMQVRFWNASGILVSTVEVAAGGGWVRVPAKKGIYLLEILADDGQRKTTKISVK